ncbi:MAG TPA: FKBP-type peptidyl-prolyl cis-trans isomerase [Bacteroidales bacterium]|nr:FKBP-type peptidyl-prolyl cis-trans isomerase [Bacteroidales bacterium]HOH23248.1 FKBP-type peptidyl-prolyl cis-trans isomerase [Bacteroidales bacterium]HPB58234.1 FKBP-type peptidyl-prolyl cis-trans isomerase [Bacteroidales bacterium]HPZ04009.1 FKBP-type peptidyl-prolyl cis-trans isomerase [Bacteroidales bacterium]HQB75652.1 FKBP-type peptidyl-prolyl cis-trans isomerase [Bacteroidales bacterium]
MTQEQKVSYALGANIGENFKTTGIELIYDTFLQGVQDGMNGANKLSQNEMQAIFNQLNEELQKRQQAEVEVEKEKGRAFLAENGKKEGVITTPSGLQYKVITMGTGAKPTATDKVKVHYHGTTIDGEVFDSSVQRGEPISFPLNQVIKGWTEGVQLMPIGSKFIFYIPSDLAYGDRGAGPSIKPGATLIFEVELFDIEK